MIYYSIVTLAKNYNKVIEEINVMQVSRVTVSRTIRTYTRPWRQWCQRYVRRTRTFQVRRNMTLLCFVLRLVVDVCTRSLCVSPCGLQSVPRPTDKRPHGVRISLAMYRQHPDWIGAAFYNLP